MRRNISDATSVPQGAHLVSSVVVIGSGPAGATVADELSRAGVDVLLLEAGGASADPGDQDALKADEASQEIEPLEKMRQRRLGGSSHQWGGRTFPFEHRDIDGAADLGQVAWPVRRDELEPYYRRAAVALDVGAYTWSAHEAIDGAPRHLLECPSEVNDESIWRWSPPVKFGRVIKDRVAVRPTVRVLTHATVTRLVAAPDARRIERLEVKAGPGHTFGVSAEHVVLAGGGLECTRLLLASGLGGTGDIVGRDFLTHPTAEMGTLVLTSASAARGAATFVRAVDGVWVRRLLQLSPQVRAREGLLNMAFALWYVDPTDPGHGDPLLSSFALARKALYAAGGFKSTGMHRRFATTGNLRAHAANVAKGLPQVGLFAGQWTRDRWLSRRSVASFTRMNAQGVYRLRFDAEQSRGAGNGVRLSRQTDSFGVPRLSIRNEVSSFDRENYARSFDTLATVVNGTGWARLVPPSREELLAVPMRDSTHQMGLIPMGSSVRDSYVDGDLTAWGHRNLHVVSSAVFPTAGMAGPTLTIVALAIRCADHLVRQLGMVPGVALAAALPRRPVAHSRAGTVDQDGRDSTVMSSAV